MAFPARSGTSVLAVFGALLLLLVVGCGCLDDRSDLEIDATRLVNELVLPSGWHEIEYGHSALTRVFELDETETPLGFAPPPGYQLVELSSVDIHNYAVLDDLRGYQADLVVEYVGPAPTLATVCHIFVGEGRDTDGGLVFVETYCEDR
jgi:hypothetical protein